MKQAKGQSYNSRPSIKHSELTAAAAASKTQGSRFSNLADNSDGSTIAPPTKHKPLSRLPTTRLEKLTDEERKQEVTQIKSEIQILKEKKEETRDAAVAESKKKRAREEEEEEEEVKKKEEKQDEEAKEEDQNEASEIELGQGWETVKRVGRR